MKKKIDKKKLEKNWGIPINLPISVENGQLDIFVQKMHTGYEVKNIIRGNLKKMFLEDEKMITFMHG